MAVPNVLSIQNVEDVYAAVLPLRPMHSCLFKQ